MQHTGPEIRITRRGFLQVAGATGLAALAGCLFKPDGGTQTGVVPPGWRPGEVRFAKSVCTLCPGGCGVVARVEEGRIVNVAGDPDNPMNQGGLCPKGQSVTQLLYNPNRFPGPMKRIGNRGEGRFELISWKRALVDLGTKLADLRGRGKPEGLVAAEGWMRGTDSFLLDRFLKAFGSARRIRVEPRSERTLALAKWLARGTTGPWTFDVTQSDLVLDFGANVIETQQPAVNMQRAMAEMRVPKFGKRGLLIAVDPRLSLSGMKADLYLPIKPGTDAALALGLAAQLVEMGAVDSGFLGSASSRFETEGDRPGFRDLLKAHSLERTAEITGLPKAKIVRTARIIGQAKRPVFIPGGGVARWSNGLSAALAVDALNALTGAVSRGEGEARPAPPLRDGDPVEPDDTASRGLAASRDLADRYPGETGFETVLSSGSVEILFDFGADVLYNAAPRFGVLEGLKKIPYVVSFATIPDETCAWSDLILPAPVFLERWIDDDPVSYPGGALYSVARPCVQPLRSVSSPGEILAQVGRGLSKAHGGVFPWATLEETIRHRASGLAGKDLRGDFDALVARGHWAGPGRKGPVAFGTKSGKYEFLPKSPLSGEEGGSLEVQTGYSPPQPMGEADKFPLLLNPVSVTALLMGQGGWMPNLVEIMDMRTGQPWTTWIEVNPETAHELHISNQETVFLESPEGSVLASVHITHDSPPGFVTMPRGLGYTFGGQWSPGVGSNPLALVSGGKGDGGLVPGALPTRVRILKTSERA